MSIVILYFSMGNEASKENSQDFLSRLTYVQLADD